jgi:hypothetical protein
MDKSNLSDLEEMKPKESKAIIKLFGEYDPQGERIIRGIFKTYLKKAHSRFVC